jgi:hypothetical protein
MPGFSCEVAPCDSTAFNQKQRGLRHPMGTQANSSQITEDARQVHFRVSGLEAVL